MANTESSRSGSAADIQLGTADSGVILDPSGGRDSAAAFHYVSEPPSGARTLHQVQPDQVIGAQFAAQAAEISLNGADLVLSFENGGAIVLEGYLSALKAGTPASLVFQDGSIYAPPTAALAGQENPAAYQTNADSAIVDTQVASGPSAQTPLSGDTGNRGGSSVYDEDFGLRGDGLQATGAFFEPSELDPGVFAPAPLSGGPKIPPPPTAAELSPNLFAAPQVQVAPANSAPNGLSLSNLSVEELPLIGLPVGFAIASDADAGDSHSYSLIADAGGRFVIDAASGLIRTAATLDFETTTSHTVIVRATDSGGATLDQAFTIAVADVNEVLGTAGADNITGTAQTDVIDSQGGNDQIDGGGGNDILLGSTGRDTVNGGAGSDVLFGEAENDILDGGAGADQLFGGSGNDSLRIDAQDTVVDGGAGTDRVDVLGAAGVTLNLTLSSIELAFGGAGDDTFDASGSNVAVRVDGGGGQDTLSGGNLADRLRGEGGNDTLFGGGGDDLLEGGTGDNSLTGSAGSDVFAINLTFGGGVFAAEGNNTIVDFAPGDVLSFRGVIDDNGDTNIDLADLNGHLTVVSAGGTTTLTFDGGGTVALLNLAGGPFASVADLTAAGLTLEGIA